MSTTITLRVSGFLIGGAMMILPVASQERFTTPEDAATALVDAARGTSRGTFDNVLGPGAVLVLSSGDAEVDRRRIADFLAAADKGRSVVDGTNGEKVLVFGANGWRFPIPLKKEVGGWRFDLAAGKQEILDRAIGQNEMTAISACADYVTAQREYYATLHDDQPVQQYARRIISTPGRHDGLYWQPETPTDRSPLGERIAAAALEDVADSGKPHPYFGYIYRILTRQGPAAPGESYDYLVNGRMLAGFALLAYPEHWQQTGVMTFLCDQRGQVFQSNLGPKTPIIAPGIRSFNPGDGWTLVEP